MSNHSILPRVLIVLVDGTQLTLMVLLVLTLLIFSFHNDTITGAHRLLLVRTIHGSASVALREINVHTGSRSLLTSALDRVRGRADGALLVLTQVVARQVGWGVRLPSIRF